MHGDADRDAHPVAGERRNQTLGDQPSLTVVGSGQQQGQLVAAQPPGGVAGPGVAAKDTRAAAQHPITVRMPVGVVQAFEVVDVEHQQGEAGATAARSRHRRRHPAAEGARFARPVSAS